MSLPTPSWAEVTAPRRPDELTPEVAEARRMATVQRLSLLNVTGKVNLHYLALIQLVQHATCTGDEYAAASGQADVSEPGAGQA